MGLQALLHQSALPAARSKADGWKIAVARGAAALEAIVPAWDDLAAHALEQNPFYEPWFMLPALAANGDDEALVCVQVWRGGRLDGLFPFVHEPRFKGLPISALRSWSHRSHMLCTPLVRVGVQTECIQSLIRWLREEGAGTAAVELRYLPGDGAFVGALAEVARGDAALVIATEHSTRALLRREIDAERYLNSALSPEARKDLRRKERRLRERGELRRVALRPGQDAGHWIAQFLALEASGWKGREGSALACTPGNHSFAKAMLTEAHRRGRLQLVGIDCGGRPISRCCNLLAGEGAYAYRTAYDEGYAQFSPGVMAEMESIHCFFATPGLAWMDSITDPNNATLNRLWKHRRSMQSVLVGVGAWGEMWVAMLPMIRWAARRLRAARSAGEEMPCDAARFRTKGLRREPS
jgi:CelD/BcsL family acetyltransferase involved in cellulose biosynthesis